MPLGTIYLRLCALMLSATLTACGGGNDFPESDTPAENTQTSSTDTAPPADTGNAPATETPPPTSAPPTTAPPTTGTGPTGGGHDEEDEDDEDEGHDHDDDDHHGHRPNRPNRPNRSLNFSAFAVDSVPSGALTAHAADGGAVAVWREANGGGHDLWRNHLRGDTWDTPALLELNAGDVGAVSVAMDPHGTAVVVWEQAQGATPAIWSARYAPTTGWSAPVVIGAGAAGANLTAPEVSFDTTGNAVARWQQTEAGATRTWQNIYVMNSGWTGASAQ